jgi:hypothetical protein
MQQSEIRENRAAPLRRPGFHCVPSGATKRRSGKQRRRNAGRRVSNLRAVVWRGAHLRVRSPVGVPPRLLGRRTNASFRLRHALPGTRGLPIPVQRAPRRPVIVPAGRICRSPRVRIANPPAGTAPAPPSGMPRESVPCRAGQSHVTSSVTIVNGKVT